ncbi:MAG: hypothetical protein NZT92_20745, partial [Abditibacteriales bacterium]|nr:hypothetical protein [Abditibacteriales bacterium]
MTRTYSWGYNNELKQITYAGGGTNTFTYDGIGRRVTKVDSTGSYSFVYDGSRILSDGHAVYTRAGDSRLISEWRGNNSRWHHSDGLTSTRTLTSSNQTTTDTFRYDVWGDLAERTGNTPTPHQFAGALGYERDADSGLYFIGTRYYDPTTGRFLSQDVAQWGMNWYAYAANNPVRNYDVGGLRPAAIYNIFDDGGGYIGGSGGFAGGGVVWDGRDWFDHLTDFMAGMGDTISLGLTESIRDLMGTDAYVNQGSGWYLGGQIAGEIWWIAFDAATARPPACFMRGTLIATQEGLKPIEAVQAGE